MCNCDRCIIPVNDPAETEIIDLRLDILRDFEDAEFEEADAD